MYQIAIVEDDLSDAEHLQNNLKRYAREQEMQMHLTVFSDAVTFTDTYRPEWDVIFLDIRMPMINGMEAAERIRRFDPEVALIYVTSLSQYAVDGYKVHAFDYILKPVDYHALAMTMSKLTVFLSYHTKKSFLLPHDEHMVKVSVCSIFYIETNRHKLIYHTDSGEYTVRDTMQNAEKMLGDTLFVRCNSCYLVNLRYVEIIERDAVIVNGTRLQMSRRLKGSFTKALTDYLGRGCC